MWPFKKKVKPKYRIVELTLGDGRKKYVVEQLKIDYSPYFIYEHYIYAFGIMSSSFKTLDEAQKKLNDHLEQIKNESIVREEIKWTT